MIINRKWTVWMALLCCILLSLHAHANNKLSIPDVLMEKGGSINLPVNLDNDDQVVALQFTLSLPDGFTIDPNTSRLTNRATDHQLRVKNMHGNDYLCMIYSINNTPLSANSGTVMYLTLNAPNTVNEGDVLPMAISDAAASDAAMNNVLSSTTAGNITIARFPDLVPSNVSTDKSHYAPGETMTFSWSVGNIGQLPTQGGWSEQIVLVGDNGAICALSTVHYNDILAANASVTRQTEVVIPTIPGINGTVTPQVRVIPNSDCGERPEAQGNNTATGPGVVLDAVLTINLSKSYVEETYNKPLSLIVTRSGNRQESLNVALHCDDSRLQLPSTITIDPDQSSTNVTFNLIDNTVVDDSDKAIITATADGYPATNAILTIEDNEFPAITATASKREVTEGETFTVTLSVPKAPATDLQVNVTCSKSSRFEYPSVMTINAGQTSVTAEFVAVDDASPDLDEDVTFGFSSDRYESDEVWITIHDNDIPDVELTLTPTTVNEGAGANAVIATLKRLNRTESEITFMISDDSEGLLSIGQRQIVMQAGVSEAQFSIAVNDNDLAEGNRTVNVTAAIYIKSCSCQAVGGQAGNVVRQLTVIDNDGPTITLASSQSIAAEGSELTLTISRNAVLDQNLTVNLSSDNDEGLLYNHVVTIPAGQRSATTTLIVESNDQTNDDRFVTLQATANGFAMGTCWLMITNQTLPDAQVAQFYISTQSVEVGGVVNATVVVTNTGVLTMPAQIRTTIYLDKSEMARLYTTQALEPGETDTLSTSFVAPDWLGGHRVYATVNEDKRIQELITGNNTSDDASLTIVVPFTTTLEVDKQSYKPGETVVFTGSVSKIRPEGTQVEIYLINNGSRQSIMATSDESGHFTAEYKPFSSQMGHFIAGSCYPGENKTEEMASFDIYGISVKNKDNGRSYATCELGMGETYNGTIVISNPCLLSQSGLTLTQKTQSGNCEFNFSTPTIIGAGSAVEINCSIKGNAVSSGSDWQEMPLEFTTAEGSKQSFTIYYFVYPQKAKLEVSTSHINTTMTHGVSRDYPVTIRNIGKNETGKITLVLPSFIQTNTPQEMASLQQGDSAVIVLRFITTDDMKLNVPVTGRLGINCEHGDGASISFQVTPVSDVNGTLRVDAVDEYTFYTDEAPHVSNANVQIKKPYTNEVVAEGLTGENGVFTAVLPEGWYTMTVTADKHDGYSNTVIVDPGVVKDEEVFLSYQTVTYSWNVVETTVEDEYVFETTATFETNVPKPVVVISLPDQQPELYEIFPIVAVNKGLLNAVDVNLAMSISNSYTFEYMNDPHLDVLGAQQEHVFYVRMMPSNTDELNVRKADDNDNESRCFTLIARAKYKELCDKYTSEELAEAIKRWGSSICGSSGIGGTGGGGAGGGTSNSGGIEPGPGRPSAYGNNDNRESYGFYDIEDPEKFCDPIPPVSYTSDCDEEPTLFYELRTADGKRNSRIGVAADGSKLLITLNPAKSKIPNPDCDEWECHWSLENVDGLDLGQLENANSWDNVVYTAPEDFPGDGSSYTVIACLTYSNGKKMGHYYMSIMLTRVPLLLVHGLRSSGDGCWKKLPKELVKSKMYESYQILKADYQSTNTAHFKENVNVVGNHIEKLLKIYRLNGVEANKADIIGHSMGGILARLHVQEVDRSNARVHKIITLNTPHSGSEVADFGTELITTMKGSGWKNYIVSTLLFYGKIPDDPDEMGAVYDLAVNSIATDRYLNDETKLGYLKNIPVHALGTIYVNSSIDDAVDLARYYPFKPEFPFYLEKSDIIPLLKFLAFDWGLEKLDDLFHGDNDLVVSLESQLGGLESRYTTIVGGPNHMQSTDNEDVINNVKRLLSLSVDSPIFSKDGFNPVDRSYTGWSSSGAPKKQRDTKQHAREVSEIHLSVENLTDSLAVEVNGAELFDHRIVFLRFADEYGRVTDSVNFKCPIPSVFSGDVKVYAFCYNNGDEELVGDSITIHVMAPKAVPVRIETMNDHYLDLGNTATPFINCIWDDGTEIMDYPDNVISSNGIVGYDGKSLTALKQGTDSVTYRYKGLSCKGFVQVLGTNEEYEQNNQSQSICSSVTLSFKQKAVLTRQAFRGTLTVNNGHENVALENMKLNLEVRDLDGNLATSHEFQIAPEALDGFTGQLDFDAGWRLESKQTGVATILFIPTKYAAPTEPKEYAFGGSFSYTDPATGMTVTRELTPVTLTVSPSPNFVMDYFLQRDIMGDDPLTEVVEPSQDAEFALLIDNQGYGDAIDFEMITYQPEIIENEKGLLINFEFVSSQLNGENATLAMGKDIATDFGSIKANSQAYAQWWLRSSLLGHFKDYNVSYNHVTSYGNEDLSLIDTVRIHELIHGFTTDDVVGKKMRGFLVNDLPDAYDQADIIHFSNATQETVAISTATLTPLRGDSYVLEVTSSGPGWNYGSVIDPTQGRQKIVSVVRQSDNKTLYADNVWTTDRTLLDDLDWLYERRLHYVVEMNGLTESYLITFEPDDSPNVTDMPFIGYDITSDYVEVFALGDGDIHLYKDGVEVENPCVIMRTEDDQYFTFTATAQEEGKLISETAEQVVMVPACEFVGVINTRIGKTVKNIRYFNIAGQEMQTPIGVTIVVTTYSDGSTTTIKKVFN